MDRSENKCKRKPVLRRFFRKYFHFATLLLGVYLVLAAGLLVFKNRISPGDSKTVEIAVGGITAFAIAIFVNVSIARPRRQQDLAMDLYKIYNSSQMLDARIKAWAFLHPQSDPELKSRVKQVWDWAVFVYDTSTLPNSSDIGKVLEGPRAVRTVCDFFSVCEQCVADRRVDEGLLKALLGHSFARWSHLNIEKYVRDPGFVPERVKKMPIELSEWNATERPLWIGGLPLMRVLCELEKPAETPWIKRREAGR